jgi:hypothetical protein
MKNPHAYSLKRYKNQIVPNKKYEQNYDEEFEVSSYLEPERKDRFTDKVQRRKSMKRRNRRAKEERDYS